MATGRLVGFERVNHVAAVGQQSGGVTIGGTRLGVLPGDPTDLDHRHRRAVRQDDRHLQECSDDTLDVWFGVRLERLGAVTTLEQERAAVSHVRQAVSEVLHLRGHAHRRDALEDLAHCRGMLRIP